MRKKLVLPMAFLFVLISISMFGFNIQSVKAEPRTWTVDDNGPADFHTIQEAINAANPRDTILVKAGTYRENVIIKKGVSLIGEDKENTILTGVTSSTGFLVTANNVTIKKFTVKDFGKSGHGIYLSDCQNFLAEDMIIMGNSYGIRALFSSQIVVRDCFMINIYSVMLEHSMNSTITKNFIQGYGAVTWGGDGVWLYHSTYNRVEGNVVTFCRISLYIIYSNYNLFSGNILNGSAYGVTLTDSVNNTMYHNNFFDNSVYDAAPFFLPANQIFGMMATRETTGANTTESMKTGMA